MPFDDTGFSVQRDEKLFNILYAARAGIAAPDGWCQSKLYHNNAKCAVGWIIHSARRSLAMDCHELGEGAHVVSERRDPERKEVARTVVEEALELVFSLIPAAELRLLGPTKGICNDPTIGDYNDMKGRTQAEMVALFDAAIARLEGRSTYHTTFSS